MRYAACGYAEGQAVTEEIDRHAYLLVAEAKATCLYALEAEEKFALLFDNFAEFEVTLLSLAESALIWGGRRRDHAEVMQERLLLDRRLANLLTSCRLYLDQSEHGMSTVFGNPSDQLSEFKKFRSQLYDGSWGYRFVEALRNHVQHSGLAAHGIAHNHFLSRGGGEDYVEHTVLPQASTKALRENPQFKRQVLDERPEGRDEIDLRGPVREYMSCIASLHRHLREVIGPRVADARTDYEAAVHRYGTIGGRPAGLTMLMEYQEDGQKCNEVHLVTPFLGYYDELFKRNVVNHDLQHLTASNTDQKR